MKNPTFRRWMAGAFAVSCLPGPLAPTAHAVGVIAVTDTITDLYLDWTFTFADSGVSAPYLGSF